MTTHTKLYHMITDLFERQLGDWLISSNTLSKGYASHFYRRDSISRTSEGMYLLEFHDEEDTSSFRIIDTYDQGVYGVLDGVPIKLDIGADNSLLLSNKEEEHYRRKKITYQSKDLITSVEKVTDRDGEIIFLATHLWGRD